MTELTTHSPQILCTRIVVPVLGVDEFLIHPGYVNHATHVLRGPEHFYNRVVESSDHVVAEMAGHKMIAR
jgi:hypothetical protein